MRNVIIGSFVGFVLAAAFLAACGGGGGVTGQAANGAAKAIDVLFDNAASGMAAENVQGALDEVDTRVDGVEGRVGLLEGHTHTASTVGYSNSTSGLSATNVQAAIDELAGGGSSSGGGHVFIRWGNTNAPTGTTKLYDGNGIQFADGAGVFVMKGGDAGTSVSAGSFCNFMATRAQSSNMPPGITADRRILGCVCYSPTPTAVVYGTHTAPSGWSILYKGYAMTNSRAVIVVDGDNFDATATTMTGTDAEFATFRFTQSPDTTNYPTDRHVKAMVISKD